MSEWVWTRGWWWNELKDERWTERDETGGDGDKDGTETRRRLLFLHRFSSIPPLLSLWFALLHLFFLLFILSLFVIPSLVFIFLSPPSSVVQTLRQMSREIFQSEDFLWASVCEVCVCTCVRGRRASHMHVCCAHILPLALKSVGSSGRSGRKPTSVRFDKQIQKAGNQIGCLKLLLHSWSDEERRGEQIFNGDLSQKSPRQRSINGSAPRITSR